MLRRAPHVAPAPSTGALVSVAPTPGGDLAKGHGRPQSFWDFGPEWPNMKLKLTWCFVAFVIEFVAYAMLIPFYAVNVVGGGSGVWPTISDSINASDWQGTWIVWLASLLFLDYVRFYAWFGRSRLAATNCTIAVLDGLRNFLLLLSLPFSVLTLYIRESSSTGMHTAWAGSMYGCLLIAVPVWVAQSFVETEAATHVPGHVRWYRRAMSTVYALAWVAMLVTAVVFAVPSASSGDTHAMLEYVTGAAFIFILSTIKHLC